ncbi:esterase family protein [Bacillus sp. ISL-35]|uniref:alpha/beta hydrolase n=1 Tax=Bacillus sp. ISL-35 TaxID=2819122 RepID=UPI001BE56961|nr:alpha/beta hydrolase-fold protein [Bacillus sp. ISL-35]MBT2678256.1 esterase family protein [Bacillus sp. ISL-35]MBT2702457.1 esterase family protein [Chryseobacterium sp. ISL-80]
MDFPMGKIEEITLQSKELGEEITMLVYLPANYSPLYKYSLLIAQDGRDYFQLGRIGRVADEFLAKKEIENVIIVGIPYDSVEDRRQKYHPKGEQHQAYIRFLAHELVPYLDERYPTYQMGMGRALVGDSLAATVSLLAAIQYPHTFGKVLLQSPYVNEEVFSAVKNFNQPELLNIYHSVGEQETVVKTTSSKNKDFLTPNRELSKMFKEKSFGYFYEEFSGDHTWTHWQPNLKRAMKRMFS